MTHPYAIPDRRVDLDWLRIAAFGLLILYHVGMFYVSWGYHVKSSHASSTIEPLMLLTNPWRLLLLFIISGAATRFMLDKLTIPAFLGNRMWRLFPPLVFGMVVIVAPQTYFEIVQKQGYAGSYWDFYQQYLPFSSTWGLTTPTWNHLWFVAYLIPYTVIIAGLGPLMKRIPARIAAPFASGALLLALPIVYLLALRLFLLPLFPTTHALTNDWYNHAESFAGFCFGYAIARHAPFFLSAVRMRWVALTLGIAGWLTLITLYMTAYQTPSDDRPIAIDILVQAAREVQAWCLILAAFGFAHKHLAHRDGPIRRYLTEAIFPFYIIHQTTIVAAGFWLDQQGLPVLLEAAILIALTAASCFAFHEIVRRVPPLRPLGGLKLNPSRPSETATA